MRLTSRTIGLETIFLMMESERCDVNLLQAINLDPTFMTKSHLLSDITDEAHGFLHRLCTLVTSY